MGKRFHVQRGALSSLFTDEHAELFLAHERRKPHQHASFVIVPVTISPFIFKFIALKIGGEHSCLDSYFTEIRVFGYLGEQTAWYAASVNQVRQDGVISLCRSLGAGTQTSG